MRHDWFAERRFAEKRVFGTRKRPRRLSTAEHQYLTRFILACRRTKPGDQRHRGRKPFFTRFLSCKVPL